MGRFAPPTEEELQLQASKIGLPQREAEKFFNYYDSKGWKVGKSPMQKWRSAMANWKLKWEEQRGNGNGEFVQAVSATTQAILWQKELDFVQTKMTALRNSYSEHQSWVQEDKDRWFKLKERKVALKKLLGMEI